MHRLALCITLAVAVSWASARAEDARSPRPNIVLIITDDAGRRFGSYGATDLKTPNIDRLARDGVRLTDFYANGATCSPTRTGLISGRYQQRTGLEDPLGSVGPSRLGARAARDWALAPATAEEQRLRDGAHRQVAPRVEERVQSWRARVRLLLRVQERLCRLLPAHRRGGFAPESRPVRE